MKKLSSSYPILIGTCLVLSALWLGESNAEPSQTSNATLLKLPIDCKPYHLRSMKVLLKSFNKCSRELKANVTDDKAFEENMGCAMKCTMRRLGYSDSSNLVTLKSIREAVIALVPDILVEPVSKMLIENCHKKHGITINPDEAQCKSYAEYAFCIQTSIADMVESEYCIKEKKPTPEPS